MTLTDEQIRQSQGNAQRSHGVINAKSASYATSVQAMRCEADLPRPAVDAEAQRQAGLKAWLENIPPKYGRWKLMDYPPDMQAQAERFIGGGAWSMYLHGGVGSRKTSYAVAIAQAWLLAGGGYPRLVPAYLAARQLRDLDRLADNVKPWRECELLILDDIGANRDTPHVVEQLLFLLQERYDWERATIIASNEPLPSLLSSIDRSGHPRAISRLQEGIVLDLGNKDYRQTPA